MYEYEDNLHSNQKRINYSVSVPTSQSYNPNHEINYLLRILQYPTIHPNISIYHHTISLFISLDSNFKSLFLQRFQTRLFWDFGNTWFCHSSGEENFASGTVAPVVLGGIEKQQQQMRIHNLAFKKNQICLFVLTFYKNTLA